MNLLTSYNTTQDNSLNVNYYTKTYIDNSINNIRSQIYNLTNGAPETLDTISEIATAIKNDASFGIVVYQKIASTDLSINDIRSQIISISITGAIQDPSINSLYSQNAIYDASFLNISNNYYTKTIVDSSLNRIRTDYDSSLNTNYYTKTFVDSSLNRIRTDYDSSLNANYYTKTFVDNNLNLNYALKTYVDTQIGNLINSAPTTLNTLSEIATALQSDASFGVNVYAKITSSDASINSIRSNYATTASLSSYATTLYTDDSLNLIRNKYDASFTSLYSSDTTLNGNLTLGSGSKSIGINKQPSSLYSLDVSGSTQITGNLSLVKNPSDANYSYFDISNVNMSVFNVSEKFYTMAYSASLALNYAQGGIFYITNVTNNVTSISITNVPSIVNRSVSFTVMLEQSSTYFFSGTQITINGTITTIFTPDATAFVAPSGARSMIIHQFVILWPTSTPKVLSYMSSQGQSV